MGFSVSGATALLLIAFLISFGAFYSATTGAVDQVQDAQVEQTDRHIETLNTDFEIESAVYNQTDDELTIEATNTGATALAVSDLSLLVDGELTAFDAAVDDNEGAELWAEQESLTLTVDEPDPEPTDDDTVKLVSSTGVADTHKITVEGN